MCGFVRDLGREGKIKEGMRVGAHFYCEPVRLEPMHPPMEQRSLRSFQAPEAPCSVDPTIHGNSSIGPIGERFARTWLKSSSKASASSSGRTASRVRRPCRSALRRTAAFPSGVFGPVERRALARFAAFCRSLVTVPLPLILSDNPKHSYKISGSFSFRLQEGLGNPSSLVAFWALALSPTFRTGGLPACRVLSKRQCDPCDVVAQQRVRTKKQLIGIVFYLRDNQPADSLG
jgi:hypothetical protein